MGIFMSKNLTGNGSQLNPGYSLKSTHFAMLSALLIMLCTTSSFANRPSMDDEESEAESSDSAPSAVEMMMQQNQQSGDILNLPAEEIRPGETIKIKLLDTPRRGASMERVRQLLGEPVETTDSVGKPPISSWIYHDRIVYFEYSTVRHAVAR